MPVSLDQQLLTVYHLQSGEVRRYLTKASYLIESTIRITDLGLQTLSQENPQEWCEFVLNKTSNLPFYRVGKDKNYCPAPLQRSYDDQTSLQRLYILENPLNLGNSLTEIYNKLTGEVEAQPGEEIGPLGLFSTTSERQWKPLEALQFFQTHAPLAENLSCSSLQGRAILVITDITGTNGDRNTIPPLDPDEGYIPNF